MNLETIEVDVNQEEIDEGNHKCICSCPVANSIKRSFEPPNHFPKLDDVSVHLREGFCTLHEQIETTMTDDHGRERPFKKLKRSLYSFELPTIARNFISTWDAEAEVRPIKFDLPMKFVRERDNMVPSSR